MDIVRCPSDNSVYGYKNKVVSYDVSDIQLSESPNRSTTYGVLGTSYSANEWQYCKPGARQGWGPPPAFVNYRSNLGPQHVAISPSRFMIFGDTGTYGWIMSTEQQRTMFLSGLSGSWWHGKEVGAMSFLDGSARLEKTGLIVNSRYSMYMVPISNPNRSTDFRFPGHAFP